MVFSILDQSLYLYFDIAEPPVVGSKHGLELVELVPGAPHHQGVVLVKFKRCPKTKLKFSFQENSVFIINENVEFSTFI